MRHYDKTDLELYRNGKMKFWQRHFCTLHLRQCESCRAVLASLKEDDRLLEELRESLNHFDAEKTSSEK